MLLSSCCWVEIVLKVSKVSKNLSTISPKNSSQNSSENCSESSSKNSSKIVPKIVPKVDKKIFTKRVTKIVPKIVPKIAPISLPKQQLKYPFTNLFFQAVLAEMYICITYCLLGFEQCYVSVLREVTSYNTFTLLDQASWF